jgi:tRNA-Thr(GGU) m(6)t(6)A37 methyltransferase TsaA
MTVELVLRRISVVRSSVTDRKDAPRQGYEGAPEASIEVDAEFVRGLDGIKEGDAIVLLTWLHQGQRDVLEVRPRKDPRNPLTGVFATRSPDRPNPIGLHRVTVTASKVRGSTCVRWRSSTGRPSWTSSRAAGLPACLHAKGFSSALGP